MLSIQKHNPAIWALFIKERGANFRVQNVGVTFAAEKRYIAVTAEIMSKRKYNLFHTADPTVRGQGKIGTRSPDIVEVSSQPFADNQ
uniref:Uncharacterized protein n=1 Tax=Sphaerodactylus townsendi TaxID=933632 RepID=A0ACB8EZ65_9SAUR